MKSTATLIGVGLVLLMLGAIMTAIENFRGDEVTATYNSTTGEGVTTQSVTLSNELLDDALRFAVVTSSDSDDAPIPYSYTSNTKVLVVSGLAESTTRVLTVVYQTPRQDSFTDTAAKFLPAFLIIGGIGCVVGAVVTAVKNR